MQRARYFSASCAFVISAYPFSAVLRRNLDVGRYAFFPSASLCSVLGRFFCRKLQFLAARHIFAVYETICR
jgi:hypothetical protein